MGEDAPILERSYRPPRQWQACSTCKLHSCHGRLPPLSTIYTENRAPKRCPDHFTVASCPTLIEARVGDENRQIVTAAVAASQRTRWTTSHIIASHDSRIRHIVENSESEF